MEIHPHVKTAGHAIKHWFLAMAQDAAAVGLLWLVGLLILRVPLAPFWAFLGGAFQFIPGVGAILGLIGPAFCLFVKDPENLMPLLYLLILYAIIAVVDGLVLQPYFMKRTAKVPFWAALFGPIIIALLIPFWWAILLAPPLLAVIFAFRRKAVDASDPGSTPM